VGLPSGNIPQFPLEPPAANAIPAQRGGRRQEDEEGARAYVKRNPPALQADMVVEYHRTWPPAGHEYGKPRGQAIFPMAAPKPCRYLEVLHHRDGVTRWCAYLDYELRGNEDTWCYPGGCQFHEAPDPPGAVVYEDGRWMTLDDYGEWLCAQAGIPEGYEFQDWKTEVQRQ